MSVTESCIHISEREEDSIGRDNKSHILKHFYETVNKYVNERSFITKTKIGIAKLLRSKVLSVNLPSM